MSIHNNRLPAAVLAAALGTASVAVYSSAEPISDVINSGKNAVVDFMNDSVYGQRVSQLTYKRIPHKIQEGDTINELSGGKLMIADYIRNENCIENVGSLQIGTEITILEASKDGTSLRELIEKTRCSR